MLGFGRLTIARKIFLGYTPMVLLLFALGSYALVSLNRLNSLARSIVDVDVRVVEAADRLADAVLAQDLYGRRFLILRDAGLAEIFWKRSAEFERLLQTIGARQGDPDPALESLELLHKKFDLLFAQAFDAPARAPSAHQDRELRETQSLLLEAIQARSAGYRRTRDDKIILGASIGDRAFLVTAVLCALGLLVAGGAAVASARGISKSLHTLKRATQLVADGRFDQVPRLEGHDELADLSRSFEGMAKKLQRMEATCLDANPLTRLPGGIAIENVVRRRLEIRRPLAFCLLDLDNFKAFGDRYGYARGSEVLLAVARLLEGVVAEKGSDQDFVGHIGGDDFVLLTTPGRYHGLCSAVIERFDAVVPDYYDEEDRKRGYITSKTRQGETAQFPLMTISIAVVTNPDFRFKDPFELGEVAAQLKECAKSISGSVYVTDGQWKKEVDPEVGVST